MAKRRQFSEDATKRIANVVRIVEHRRRNERPPDGKARLPPQVTQYAVSLDATLSGGSTGVQATILTGAPPNRSSGTGSGSAANQKLTVYATFLSSTASTIDAGKKCMASFITG